jgi:3-hydroxyacyl-[acyl-carrier-protein] dehydratase
MLNREEIEAILPHRAPFLFVDSVSAIVPGERIEGEFRLGDAERYLAISGEERFFPPALLAESMAQVGAILVLFPEENRGRTIYFRAIEEMEFASRVKAGARIRIVAEVRKLKARYGSLSVQAFVGGELVARGVMSFAL